MRRALAAPLAVAASLSAAPASAEGPAGDAAYLGARGPAAGQVVLQGGLGLAFILPQVSLAARAGTGAGGSVELRYRNLAAFGHEGRLRLGWGAAVTPAVDVGLAFRTSYMSLAQADGGLIGIQFSNLALGNDWEMGNDLLVTWNREGLAHVTASVGPNWSLGGLRYVTYRERELTFDPSFRSIDAAIQGEWALSRSLHVLLRLDAMFLVDSEIVPIGFLPTGTLGLGWRV